MKTFRCEEISCNHCVSRIENGLKEAGIKHSVDLDSKLVTIDGGEDCTANAIEVLDDLGFSAVEV